MNKSITEIQSTLFIKFILIVGGIFVILLIGSSYLSIQKSWKSDGFVLSERIRDKKDVIARELLMESPETANAILNNLIKQTVTEGKATSLISEKPKIDNATINTHFNGYEVLFPIRMGDISFGTASVIIEKSLLGSIDYGTVAMMILLLVIMVYLTIFYRKAVNQTLAVPFIELERAIGKIESLKYKFPRGQQKIAEIASIESKIEKMLAALQKAKEKEEKLLSQAAIGKVASQVSHDLGTPLSMISGIMSKLRKNKTYKKDLDILEICIKRMSEISSDLLKKNKQKKNKSVQQKKEYLLVYDVLEEALTGISYQCSELQMPQVKIKDNISLRTRDLKIKGIRKDIVRVLANILTNALEAMKNGNMSEPKIAVFIEENGGNIIIKISDNGPGIEKVVQKQLFEKRITTKDDKGNGLGLLYTKEIIEQHDGSIAFESSNMGTTFRIIFPIPSELRTVRLISNEPVLVVEDDTMVLEMWKAVFQNAKVPVILKEIYDESLVNRKYSCVISDYNLRGSRIDGMGVLEKFSPTIPRYLCTSDSDRPDLLEKTNKEGVIMLSKPPFEDRYTIIKEYTDNCQSIRDSIKKEKISEKRISGFEL